MVCTVRLPVTAPVTVCWRFQTSTPSEAALSVTSTVTLFPFVPIYVVDTELTESLHSVTDFPISSQLGYTQPALVVPGEGFPSETVTIKVLDLQ